MSDKVNSENNQSKEGEKKEQTGYIQLTGSDLYIDRTEYNTSKNKQYEFSLKLSEEDSQLARILSIHLINFTNKIVVNDKNLQQQLEKNRE